MAGQATRRGFVLVPLAAVAVTGCGARTHTTTPGMHPGKCDADNEGRVVDLPGKDQRCSCVEDSGLGVMCQWIDWPIK